MNKLSRSLIAAAALALAAVSMGAKADSTQDAVITEARANAGNTRLTVTGSNLGASLSLTLGASTVPLSVVSATPTQIVAALPTSIAPGSYLLTVNVSKKNDDAKVGSVGSKDHAYAGLEFWVTFGAVGPQGSAGLTGSQGPIGLTGTQGLVGATGAVGPMGPVGARGVIGPVGPVGTTGAVGAVGPAGAQGVIGPVGATGVVGATGATGAVGPTGPQGIPGTNGVAGAPGPVWPRGSVGAPARRVRPEPAPPILSFRESIFGFPGEPPRDRSTRPALRATMWSIPFNFACRAHAGRPRGTRVPSTTWIRQEPPTTAATPWKWVHTSSRG